MRRKVECPAMLHKVQYDTMAEEFIKTVQKLHLPGFELHLFFDRCYQHRSPGMAAVNP